MGTASSPELVIVGAGAAGLGAARAAREMGIEFVVLEAMNRIGGRAHTDVETFGLPWDYGCHWLHSADVNPFTGLADEYGFRYKSSPTPWRVRVGSRWATDLEATEIDRFIEGAYDAIHAAANEGRDVPVSDVVDLDDRSIPQLRGLINGEWGVDLDEASTADIANYRDTDKDWPVQDGYGALVARHGAGLPVTLSTPVERVDWGGKGVNVTTAHGALEAQAVIVTVSTGVLTAETIEFAPALPDWKREAIENLPLGKANKVALHIEGGVSEVDGHTNVFVQVGPRETLSLQLNPFGTNLANAYLAGPFCAALEREGKAAMVEVALSALVSVVGSDVRRRVGKTLCSSWESEPTIRGAYAAARPGQAHRRTDLARPLDDRIFFAGEATSPDFFSTCHGAYLSGISAVESAARVLRAGAAAGDD